MDRTDPSQNGSLARVFSLFFGAFLGLALFKFGNPPIFESWVTTPKDIYELLLGNPWPIVWAYGLLILLALLGVAVAHRKLNTSRWVIALPAAWLLWECMSAFWTVDPGLTKPTLAHFLGCVVCFYLGLCSLGETRRIGWLLPGLLVAFLLVIAVGWEQHFGGLEQTRRYFFAYLYPRMKEVPPDYLKKMSSTRIFSTLFYPNALAGAILLLLPVSLEFIWQARQRFTQAARLFLVCSVGTGALACLYWSGSKGGWLLMLVLGLIWLLRLPFNPSLKRGLIGLILIVGVAGFFWRYSGFFQRGATSVGARFDYWQAAARTTLDHPLFGTGPGTFAIAYAKVKRPEWEMSRLVHNDYLEQASDSGLPGFVFYAAFIVGALVFSAPGCFAGKKELAGKPGAVDQLAAQSGRTADSPPVAQSHDLESTICFALWLGVLGWALQGLLEFSLYIPGLAWPAFAFMGLLLARPDQSREVIPKKLPF